MGDESDPISVLRRISHETGRDIIDVLTTVYGGGYINQKLTFEERKALRAKSYRALKALGIEK